MGEAASPTFESEGFPLSLSELSSLKHQIYPW